jgi:hypothetical protein
MPQLALTLCLDIYADSLKHIREGLVHVPDDRLTEQLSGLNNHAAWTLSHLSSAAGFMLQLLDEPIDEATGLHMKLHGSGSFPTAIRSDYLSKTALLDGLTDRHARFAAAVLGKHEAYMAREAPESIRSFAPTIGRVVVYLLAAHEPYHQGQSSGWMKAAKL